VNINETNLFNGINVVPSSQIYEIDHSDCNNKEREETSMSSEQTMIHNDDTESQSNDFNQDD
jgi:hypothetical protein